MRIRCYTDASGDVHFDITQMKRPGEQFGDAPRHDFDLRCFSEAGQQHYKLVPTLAGHDIGTANTAADSMRRFNEQPVPHIMAEFIVDFL